MRKQEAQFSTKKTEQLSRSRMAVVPSKSNTQNMDTPLYAVPKCDF